MIYRSEASRRLKNIETMGEGMNRNRDLLQLIQDRAFFLKEFLRHPQQIGSVVPSSRYLEQKVVEAGAVHRAGVVAELGPGTGGITRAILDALPRDGALVSIDINQRFCEHISRIGDPRLTVHCGNAMELEDLLKDRGLGRPDAVVSGIPFSTLSPDTGEALLEMITALLAPGGRFVAYQVRGRVRDLTDPLLGGGQVHLELRSIPPQRVYWWKKRNEIS